MLPAPGPLLLPCGFLHQLTVPSGPPPGQGLQCWESLGSLPGVFGTLASGQLEVIGSEASAAQSCSRGCRRLPTFLPQPEPKEAS